MKFNQLIGTGTGKISKKNFPYFGRLDPKSRPFSIYQPTVINQRPILMSLRFFGLLKMSTETIEKWKHHLIKIKRSHYTTILSKS